MSNQIVKNQYVISLRNGMTAYIIADKIEDIAAALQNNKFFNTREQMMINTADIVAIMSPAEYSNQQKHQRGWYLGHSGTKWFNKKGEYEEESDLGMLKNSAVKRAVEIDKMDDSKEKTDCIKKLIKRAKEVGVYSLIRNRDYTFEKLADTLGKD